MIKEFVVILDPAALIVIGSLGTGREGKGQIGAAGKGRVFAPVVIADRMRRFDSAVGGCVDGTQTGNNFARCKDLNLEFAVRRFLDAFRQLFAAAINRIE